MKTAVLVIVAVALAASASTAKAAHRTDPTWQLSIEKSCPEHFEGIAYYRGQVWRLERRMGRSITRASYAEHAVGNCDQVAAFVVRWRKLTVQRQKEYSAYVKRQNARPAHYDGWMCIHRLEGAWNDSGAPYYGGLQMSWNWMNAVPGGDAGKLPAMQQMRIAEAVSAKNGFSYAWMKGQWPNTYPPCAGHF